MPAEIVYQRQLCQDALCMFYTLVYEAVAHMRTADSSVGTRGCSTDLVMT